MRFVSGAFGVRATRVAGAKKGVRFGRLFEWGFLRRLDLRKGLVEVGDDVVYMLDADRHADKFGQDSRLALFALGELAVRRACGVEYARTRVGDVAERVGYGDYITFYKAFMRAEGISPTDYRNTMKQDKEPKHED